MASEPPHIDPSDLEAELKKFQSQLQAIETAEDKHIYFLIATASAAIFMVAQRTRIVSSQTHSGS